MKSAPRMPRVKPPALQPGDKIGIAAPASNVNADLLERGCAKLREMGYAPFYLDSILEQDLYFAGTLERRTGELHQMFERDDVRGILFARGGYGANYLLEKLDLRLIASHPKILCGYSDLTSLLTYVSDHTGLVTFHGPMVTKDLALEDGIDIASWEAAFRGSDGWELPSREGSGVTGLAPGRGEGMLYGGCLSILAASLGTPYEIDTQNTLLFLEDVGAKPYQVDRMLMQLRLAGKLDEVRGVIFGEMLECVQAPDQPYTLQEVVLRVLSDLAIPIAYGLRSGHVSRRNVTLPLGVKASLAVEDEQVSIQVLEPATVAAGASYSTVSSVR